MGMCSLLAQLVEHYLDKVGVSSSSLLETTIYIFRYDAFKELCCFYNYYDPLLNAGRSQFLLILQSKVALIGSDLFK